MSGIMAHKYTKCRTGRRAATNGTVFHESIYRDLYMPSRKVFDASMFDRLRSERPIRRPRGKKRSHGRGQIRNMVSIRERRTEADTRQVARRRCRSRRSSRRRIARATSGRARRGRGPGRRSAVPARRCTSRPRRGAGRCGPLGVAEYAPGTCRSL
jgi:hypothetical protein